MNQAALYGLFAHPSSGAPEDARSLAWDQLRKLKRRIASGRSSHEDAYTRVHLDESLMKIDRALDAKVVIGSAAPARSQSRLEMLGLGDDKKPQYSSDSLPPGFRPLREESGDSVCPQQNRE